jgi:hypothetical protein
LRWQAKEGNPVLVEHALRFERDTGERAGGGRHYSEYRLPFGELVAEIVEKAPAGTRADRLASIVRNSTRDFIHRQKKQRFKAKKKREHSPESDLKRAATIAKKAVEREIEHAGRSSAINAFRAEFNRAFCALFDLAISEKTDDNAREENDLAETLVECPEVTRVSQGSDEFRHVGSINNVTKLSDPPEAPVRGSHPPEGDGRPAAAAPAKPDRGCDPSQADDVPKGVPPLPPELVELEAFRGVGATRFEYFFVDPETDEKTGPYREASAEEFAANLTELVGDAERGGVSLVALARFPEGAGAVLQIDDCDPESALVFEPFSFFGKETSANRFQSYLAFKDPWDKADVAARLWPRLRELKLAGNSGSGGATRWCGSINQKPSRNGFRVRVDWSKLGRFTTPSELDDAGLLADPLPPVDLDWQSQGEPRAWPDYTRCLSEKPDRSSADAQFVYFAFTRGRSPKEIAAKLLEVSPRAKESGAHYVNRTVAAGLAYWKAEVASEL